MISMHNHLGGTRWLHLWIFIKQSLKSSEDEKYFTQVQALVHNPDKYQADMQCFFYHTSHNLKGSVSRLNGLVELLMMDSSQDMSKQYLVRINREVKQMNKMLGKLQIINEIIKCEEDEQVCQPEQIINQVLGKYQHHISEKNIFIRIYAEEDYAIQCKESLLFWTLDNLIENAIVFSQLDGDHQSYIEIYLSEVNGQLKIVLEDNGEGIRKESQERVKELFYRDSLRSEGGGIGLYIVDECIKKLKGSIRVQSETACYTRFELTLPKLMYVQRSIKTLQEKYHKV